MTSKVASHVVPVAKKYTQQSFGVWESIRRFFAVDPDRSNGIPVKNFRAPPPGSLDPNAYDDPVTLPAADIADNPYWKRDVRRSYPKLSQVSQGDVVGLLSYGSAAAPSERLGKGEEGSKQLVAVKEEGEKGLATFFEKEKSLGKGVLSADGMPPLPPTFKVQSKSTYEVLEEQAYKNEYPCRSFA